MKPHSVYIAVVGGSDADIAEAIYNTVSGGCDYNGNTTFVYSDPITGVKEPILFERPKEIPFKINVHIKGNDYTPADIGERIKANVLADFYGEEYPNPDSTTHAPASMRVAIGDRVFSSRFYCPVISSGVHDVISITLQARGKAPANIIELLYDEYPSLVLQDINVFVEY